MRKLQMSVMCGAIAVLAGCGPTPSVRDIPPTNMDEVVKQSESGGDGGRSRILDMGVTSISNWRKKSIPVVKNAKTITAWFYPMKSTDGRTIRHGFYADHIVESASWGMWDSMHKDAINLSALGSMGVNERGQLVVDQRRVPPPHGVSIPEARRDSLGSSNPKFMPWTPDNPDEVRQSVTVIDENTSTITNYNNTSRLGGNTASLKSSDGTVDMGAVRDLIRNAQGSVSAMGDKGPAATFDGQNINIKLDGKE